MRSLATRVLLWLTNNFGCPVEPGQLNVQEKEPHRAAERAFRGWDTVVRGLFGLPRHPVLGDLGVIQPIWPFEGFSNLRKA